MSNLKNRLEPTKVKLPNYSHVQSRVSILVPPIEEARKSIKSRSRSRTKRAKTALSQDLTHVMKKKKEIKKVKKRKSSTKAD